MSLLWYPSKLKISQFGETALRVKNMEKIEMAVINLTTDQKRDVLISHHTAPCLTPWIYLSVISRTVTLWAAEALRASENSLDDSFSKSSWNCCLSCVYDFRMGEKKFYRMVF